MKPTPKKVSLTQQVNHLDQRFDRHLEIYANNSKESKRVADAIERMEEHSRCRDVKVDEMYAVFNDGKVATKIAKWMFAFLIALGGAWLMIKQIIR